MRIHTNRGANKKWTIAISIAAILLTAIAIAYYYNIGPFTSKTNDSVNLDPPTENQRATGNDIKQGSLEQINTGKDSTGSDPAPAPQPIAGSDKKSAGMEISVANQTDSTLQIRAFIQTVTNNGTCNLSMKNTQDATYTEIAGVQALSSSTTCKGFDIPLDQLAAGAWTLNLSFSNDTLIASTSKEITIK